MTKIDVSRRTFIRTAVAAGGGLLLGFRIPGLAAYAQSAMPEPWNGLNVGNEVNAWLAIDPEGIVTVRCPHTEMGQGAMTSVGMMIAEELNVPWENIRVVFADANRHVTQGEVYVNMSTGGSNLVRNRHPHIMQAGASARERLKQAAAEAWSVDRSEVTAEQGMLSAGGNSGTYGEFATAAATVSLDEEPAIKPYGDWWLIGTEIPRMDVPVKTDGSAIYPVDVVVPDMVFAAVMASPVPGGRLVSFDFDAIKDRPGVIAAVELPQTAEELANADLRSGVAVVADNWYRAKTALELMPIEWDFRGNDQYSFSGMDAEARELLGQVSQHAEEVRGDPRPMLEGAEVIEGEYARPYETNCPMSPPAAVVQIQPDRVDVWAMTQNVAATLLLVAEQLAVDPATVFVHGTYIGGAFGYGNHQDSARQAAEIAKQVGRPVKVLWSREEDQRQSRTRPPVWARFQAVLGEDGLPSAALARTVAEPKNPDYADRAIANMPYNIPNYRYERHIVDSNLPVGPNRAPGVNNNTFAIEQYVDEMAIAGDWDPLEWRIKMTEGNERYQRVLTKMKEVADFTPELGRGMGMGVAVVEDHGTIAGCCATVEVSRRGSLFVDKILLVTNSGYVFNPRAAREQLEGSVAWELSHALYGGLRLENGRVVNTNFDTYNLMRIPEMPQVEVVFASSEDQWWGGYGEPGGPPAAAAVANAIFFATGKRVRVTPIMSQDLTWG